MVKTARWILSEGSVVESECDNCRSSNRRSVIGLVTLIGVTCLFGGDLFGQDTFGSVSEEDSPPELSLETLLHPKKKRAMTTSLPATHWLVDGQESQLLVKRDDTWMRRDLRSGVEFEWPVVGAIADRLSTLQGTDSKQAQESAAAAVTQLKQPSGRVLARVGKGLAVVSRTDDARWLTRDATKWGNATIDPIGRRVAYTQNGDLFLVDIATGRTLRMTRDESDTLLDGVLDWTYQEEIFGRGNYKGFWFSPDGNWLAMLRIDISGVPVYTLPLASSDRGAGIIRRYPKAGDPIPHANLLIWDLRNFDQGTIPAPRLIARSTPQDQRIITGVWWHARNRTLLFSISDRTQTWRELRAASEAFLLGNTNDSTLLLREESPAWVEPPSPPAFLADGSLVWRSELPTGRYRLYHLSPDGSIATPVSPEDFDVHDYYVATDGTFAIVTGDRRGVSIERHAYRIDLRADGPMLQPITTSKGWHDISISPRGDFIVDAHSTPSEPPTLLLQDTSGDLLREISGESVQKIAASELLLESALIEPEVFRIETEDGVPLPAMLYRPEGASEQTPCPVVLEIYGGPQAPVVTSRWSSNRALYRELLAREGIATLVVDNRSSAGRGIGETWGVKWRLGEVELGDILEAVGWLEEQPWVDDERLAIRGWSYGGFMTLYAMTHSDAFCAGIAGGSVTDWLEYDAFYTERYMGLPLENKDGYAKTSPVAKAADLNGRVLMIHGEADDNVHPSGTFRMADALQKAGIDFELMIYPGAAHAVRHPGQVWHMGQMTHRFLLENLLNRQK